MEIRGEKQEEKAELLTEKIREVIKKKEGARVYPQEAAEAETYRSFPRSWSRRDRGHGREGRRRRCGSGAARFGRRRPGRAPPGLTARRRWVCGWRERLGLLGGDLSSGKGGSPMLPLPGARASRAVVPLGDRPRGLLPGVRG